MKIALFFSIMTPYTGGAAEYLKLLLKYYEKDPRIDEIVLITEYHPSRLVCQRGKVNIFSVLPRRHSRKTTHFFGRLISWVFTQIAVVFCFMILRKKYTVHLHGSLKSKIIIIISALLKLRLIVDIRDTFVNPNHLDKAMAVIAATQNTYDFLFQNLPHGKVKYIPVPFDFDNLYKCAGAVKLFDYSRYVLFVGRLDVTKGVIELLKAFAQYIVLHKSVKLLMVGINKLDFDPEEAYDNVIYLGERPHCEVIKLIQNAGVVILPSRGEALGRVCIEAIALNTPVICPPGVPEFMQWCRHCVLEDVTQDSIFRKLSKPWVEYRVSYFPLPLYDIRGVANTTIELYQDVSQAHQ